MTRDYSYLDYEPILDRNKRYGTKVDFSIGEKYVSELKPPKTEWPKDWELSYYNIARFLIRLHKKMGYEPKREITSYLKEVKILVDKFGYQSVIEAMIKSISLSGMNQFSFKFVQRVLEDEIKSEDTNNDF